MFLANSGTSCFGLARNISLMGKSMEKMLLKLARQLDGLDEASLMSLWSKYALETNRFEPTRRWEEACLVFSLIQAKRWKNQLFNYCWQQQKTPPLNDAPEDSTPFDFSLEREAEEPRQSNCKVMPFRPLEELEDED